MSKALVCPCEDVTVDDVESAIAKGHTDIESIKRYTGFGTGICQGKSCMGAVARILHKSGKRAPEGIAAFTPRTPIYPTEMSVLATAPVDETKPPCGGVPVDLQTSSPELRSKEPLPKRAKVVIIGGGIMGTRGMENMEETSYVTVYVAVPDVEEALKRAEELGGTRVMGPMDVPGGPTLGLFNDPEGHMVGVVNDVAGG